MGYKLRKLLATCFFLICFISANFLPTKAAVRSWNAGDVFVWGIENRVFTSTTDLVENVTESVFMVTQEEIKYNITSIDTFQKEYDAYSIAASGTHFINDRDYDWDEFSNDQFNPTSFYNVNFVWDFEHNVSVCTTFEIDLDSWFLIEPDWESLNDAIVDLFDEDILLDTVADPFEPITHNFTLADITDNTEFLVMGEDSLSNALTKFTTTTTLWTFEANLSNYVMTGIWNGTLNIYSPYDIYYQYLSLNFTEGGVLSSYNNKVDYSITVEGQKVVVKSEILIVLGGKDKLPDYDDQFVTITETSGALLTQIILMTITSFTISIIVYKRRRK